MLHNMFDWVWSISPLWWLSIALGVGTLLVAIGWRGRRIGDEPRCRRCGYILSELPSPICPECGVDSSRRKPRRGVRKVRAIPLIAGVLVLLTSISPAVWIWQSTNWRGQAPLSVLKIAMDFGDAKAEPELNARVQSGLLSSDQIRALADRALAVQETAPIDSPRLTVWLKLLSNLDLSDKLTDEQWERMVKQSVRNIRIRVRERNRRGWALPIECEVDAPAPSHARISVSLSIRTAPPPMSAIPMWRDPFALQIPFARPQTAPHTVRALERVFHNLPIGARSIDVDVDAFYEPYPYGRGVANLECFARPSDRTQLRTVRHRESSPQRLLLAIGERNPNAKLISANIEACTIRRSLTAQTEIIDAASDDDIVPLHGETVREQLRAALRVEAAFSQRKYEGFLMDSPTYEIPAIRLSQPLPFAAAFKVRAIYKGKKLDIGEFWFPAGSSSGFEQFENTRLRDMTDEPIRLELIPNPNLARRDVEMQYAAETIELGPIKLNPRK